MSVQLKLFEENIKHNPISPPWTLSCWLSKHTIAMIRFVVTLFNYPFSPTVLVDPAIPILIGGGVSWQSWQSWRATNSMPAALSREAGTLFVSRSSWVLGSENKHFKFCK